MNKQFIINYIKQVKKEDIAFFALNQGLNVSNKELDLIYYYIKNEYERFFNNPKEIFEEVYDKLAPDNYQKLIYLYNKYRFFIT